MEIQAGEEQLRQEFNRQAEAGRGEGMEKEHLPIVLPMLALMELGRDEAILDVGCGTGWLSRLLAERVPLGRVVGMDLSDTMIQRARAASGAARNLTYIVGGVDSIPWPPERTEIPREEHAFSRVVSVESAYYWPRPEQGLKEIFRVLGPGGSAWVLINYYRDNPCCHRWAANFAIPTHLLSAGEWIALFRQAGFTPVAEHRIPDPTPPPEKAYSGRWFRDADELRRFREIGALLVSGIKPTAAGH